MKKHILYLLGAVILLGSCNQDRYLDIPSASKSILPPGIPSTDGGQPGILHVQVQSDVLDEIKRINPGGVTLSSAPSLLTSTLNSIGATQLRPLFNMDPRFEKRFRASGLDRWYEIHFDENQDLRQTLNTLIQSEQFSLVEPVFATSLPKVKVTTGDASGMESHTVTGSDMPFDDPLLAQQWHYKNFGNKSRFVEGADINAFEAWKTETGKPSVIVAIVDGGIDITHEDLVDNLWINPGEIPGNNKDDDGNGYIDDVHGWNFYSNTGKITLDDVGHGTHVAGTVAARNNNGIGVAGMAGGDGTPGTGIKLMSCQKFEDKYGVSAEDAFRYSADNGAVISQNSWGYDYPGPGALPSAMKAAIDYFIKYAGCDGEGNQLPDSPMKGGVVLFAAGNDGKDYKAWPGAYEATISISSMAPDWTQAYYTNRGDWVDIMAPGGDYEYGTAGAVFSTLPAAIYGEDKKYGDMQGTSMACPHASGVAALIVSHFGGQGFTNEDLKKRLLGSLRSENIDAHNPGYEGRLGVGYLDAARAFDTNQNKKPGSVTDLTAEAGYMDLILTWSAVADEDDGTPVKYLVYYSDKELTADNYKQLTPITVAASGLKPGEKVHCTVSGLTAGSTYYAAVVAVDRWGLESEPTVCTATTKQNNPPAIEGLPEESIRVSGIDKKEFSLTLSDPDNHKVSYRLGGETRGVSVSRTDNVLKFTLRAVAPVGIYEIKLKVTDELGASTEAAITFEVYKAEKPGVSQSFPEVKLEEGKATQTFDLTQYFSGTDLHFAAQSSDESVVTATVDGNTLTISGKKQGSATIIVTATGTGNQSVQSSIQVNYGESRGQGGNIVQDVYPIPAVTKLNIEFHPDIKKADVSIRSLLGEEVFSHVYSVSGGKISVNVQQLSAGAYTLIVNTSKGTYKQVFAKQ